MLSILLSCVSERACLKRALVIPDTDARPCASTLVQGPPNSPGRTNERMHVLPARLASPEICERNEHGLVRILPIVHPDTIRLLLAKMVGLWTHNMRLVVLLRRSILGLDRVCSSRPPSIVRSGVVVIGMLHCYCCSLLPF